MIKTFMTSFKLENAYKTNSMIYSLKGLPIIKKILPNSLYKSKGLKIIVSIINIFKNIIGIFLWKFIYIMLMIFLVSQELKTNTVNTFLHIFTFLSLIGGVMNTHFFTPSKDKYYALILMKMDAKKYAISSILALIIENIIGLIPFTIIFGLRSGLPLIICMILPVFVVMIKLIFINYELSYFKKAKNSNKETPLVKVAWILTIILFIASYMGPVVGIMINRVVFTIIFAIISILGMYSFIKICNFKEYEKMYKKLITVESVQEIENLIKTENVKQKAKEQIEYEEFVTNKKGFSYIHELFVKRHKKILTKAVKKQAIVIVSVLIIAIIAVLMNKDVSNNINNMMLTYLPYSVFIMYILNRGTTLTQAMFMNCDYSMLTYRIYRTPKVVLGLFKQRLKTLIKINLVPAIIIAIGLPLLLYLTGGTDNILNYAVLFITIISMSIFFSVHYLVMYYLLQPYNVATEMKNSTYVLVQNLTYVVCYFMTELKLPTIPFGIVITTFSILYCIISLILAYKLAPKTFKLRV